MRKLVVSSVFLLLAACGDDFTGSYQGELKLKYNPTVEAFEEAQKVTVASIDGGLVVTLEPSLLVEESRLCDTLRGTLSGNTLKVAPAECPAYTDREFKKQLKVTGGSITFEGDKAVFDVELSYSSAYEEDEPEISTVPLRGSLARMSE